MAFGFDDAIALAGAGAKLFGGGPSPKAQANAQVRAQLWHASALPGEIRKGAEAAGFNPLVFAGPMSSPSYGVSPGASFGERAAQAAQGVLGYFGEEEQLKLQQTELDQRERELKLREEQARKAQSVSTLASGALTGRPRPGQGVAIADQSFPVKDSEGVTDYVVGGVPIKGNPNTSNAQKIEDRHGDLVSWLYGFGTLAADAWYNRDLLSENETLGKWGEKAAKGARALRKVAENDRKEREKGKHHYPDLSRDGTVMRSRNGAGWPYSSSLQLNPM